MTSSTTLLDRAEGDDPPPPRRSRVRRRIAWILRWAGTLLIGAAAIVLLYSVYLTWFTGLQNERVQRELADDWQGDLSLERPVADISTPVVEPEPEAEPAAPGVEVGEAYAALWFERSGRRIVADDPLMVVEGVTVDALKRGPGRYPHGDIAGGDGNFSVAGHRTTYGAAFGDLDELAPGDTIHVMDRDGVEWVYGFREHRVVQPTEMWVVGEDPLGDGSSTITLTTCHPRHSAAQRLIAWGELLGTARRD